MRNYPQFILRCAQLFLVLTLTACGGGGSGDSGGGTGSNNHVVDAMAGTNGSIAPVSANVVDGNTTSFTVTPDSGYSIDGVTGCGGSLSGNTYTTGAITAGCSVSATFVLISDSMPPTVSSTTPADGATNVEPDSDPTVTFSEAMLASSIDNTTIVLQGSSPVAVTIDFDGDMQATLTPDTPLALITNYVARVTTAVTDLVGNALASEASWTFTTRDGNWQTPQLLEINNSGGAALAQIAVDPAGNAMAVWRKNDGIRENIQASRFTVAGGWASAQLIEIDNAGDARSPQIAFDSFGDALAVWSQFDGTIFNIWANRFTPAGGWGEAELIEFDDTGSADHPQIAIDLEGNALVVWHQSDSARTNIWAVRFVWANRTTPAGGWDSAEMIETDNAGSATIPQIGIDSAGNGLAVWQQFDGSRGNIWANRFTPAVGWGSAELIETTNAVGAFDPQIAVDPTGDALAVWWQSDGIGFNINANRFTPTGGWGSAELIENDNEGSAIGPQITIDPSGNALAVWHQFDATRANIWANRYTPAGGWGIAELIETDNLGSARFPQIVVDAAGNALAVWHQSDGTRNNIVANRFTPADGWGNAELIEIDDGDGFEPRIAVDSAGRALAVWFQSKGGLINNVHVNRFE